MVSIHNNFVLDGAVVPACQISVTIEAVAFVISFVTQALVAKFSESGICDNAFSTLLSIADSAAATLLSIEVLASLITLLIVVVALLTVELISFFAT